MFGSLQRLYYVVIYNHHRATTFIILASFLITFVTARSVIYLMDHEILPDWYIWLGQTHVHHLNYGIFLLSIAGYLSLVFRERRAHQKLSVVYGIGLGLTLDEFSLWFHLQDNYYARVSYEAVVVIAVILINIVYFGDLWKRISQFLARKKIL